jgi:hypothetical protein
MQPEAILAILLPLAAAGILICALALRYRNRVLKHQERMAAIEKGLWSVETDDLESSTVSTTRVYLLRGLLWLFGGLGLILFLVGLWASGGNVKTAMQRTIQAQRLKNMGASEELIQQVQHDTTPERALPLGVCLVGLVPVGVGLAYLVFYRRETRRLCAITGGRTK